MFCLGLEFTQRPDLSTLIELNPRNPIETVIISIIFAAKEPLNAHSITAFNHILDVPAKNRSPPVPISEPALDLIKAMVFRAIALAVNHVVCENRRKRRVIFAKPGGKIGFNYISAFHKKVTPCLCIHQVCTQFFFGGIPVPLRII